MTRSTSRYTKLEQEFGIAIVCDFTCSWCRRTGDDEGDPDGGHWQIDHIKPRSAGGSNALANKTLSCADCNRKKAARRYLAPPHAPITLEMVDEALEAWYSDIAWVRDLIAECQRAGVAVFIVGPGAAAAQEGGAATE
jgi:hypothetical protein